MLENWCWEPAALARMSRHHATGVPIPAPLMDALLRSRNANQGVLNMRQIVLGTFDQVAFSAPLARGLLLGFFGGFRSRKAPPPRSWCPCATRRVCVAAEDLSPRSHGRV